MGPAWPGLPGHGGVTVYSTDLHQPGAVPVTHLGTGYMQPVVVGLIQTVRESSPLTKIEKQLQLTSDVSPTTIKRASSQEPTI